MLEAVVALMVAAGLGIWWSESRLRDKKKWWREFEERWLGSNKGDKP